MDLALNNLQRLICYKTQIPNQQPNPQIADQHVSILASWLKEKLVMVMFQHLDSNVAVETSNFSIYDAQLGVCLYLIF